MKLRTIKYKKVYPVLGNTLEVVVSVFVEEEDEATVDQYSNYEKIVSKCLFPPYPTVSLCDYSKGGYYSKEELGERVNDFLTDKLTQYEVNKIMETFAHYHIARYVDNVMLDEEVVVGINKNTKANGVVYTIKDEKVLVGLADDAKVLPTDDDPPYEIDEDFKAMIESINGKTEGEKETAEDRKNKNGGQNRIWRLLIVFLVCALLCGMVAILMSGRDRRNNKAPIIPEDTIEHPDSTGYSPDDEGEIEDEEERGVGKGEDQPMRGRGDGQEPVKKNGSGRPTNPSKVNPSADPSTSIEEVDEKQDDGGGDIQKDTIVFPYGLYYGEYKTINGRRYPYGAGIMKYNQRTALRSTTTGWRYRYVKAGYELSGVWEGEAVKCGKLFDGSAVRTVLDSVSCK